MKKMLRLKFYGDRTEGGRDREFSTFLESRVYNFKRFSWVFCEDLRLEIG